MYAALWRSLPGPIPVKFLIAFTLAVACTLVLFMWVFPLVAPYMPFNDGTVTQ